MTQNLETVPRRKLFAAIRSKVCVVHFGAMMITIGVIGCGGGDDFKPKLGLVKGTVTINGAPASDLQVTFEPQSAGSGKEALTVGTASTANTDAQGKFELLYGGTGEKGAVVGPHVVRIDSAAGGGPAGGESGLPPRDIPEIYTTKSTLKANVVAGENPPFDFKLEIPQK